MATIEQGRLYREFSQPEVYVIHDRRRIRIPTQDALFAMGYSWGDVQTVADGSLGTYERFDIPSGSPTPGSLVFPPDISRFGSFQKSHYPLKVGNTVRLLARSHVPTAGMQEVQLVELRGWLLADFGPLSDDGAANPEGPGYDMSFELLPDYRWLRDNGFDLNRLIKVGSIVMVRAQEIFGTTAQALVSVPAIHVEFNSWNWQGRIPVGLPSPPSDWVQRPAATWPFGPDLKQGQYVSVYGSLVTDNAHVGATVWGDASKWGDGHDSYDEAHPGRYTEVHPVDLVVPRPDPTQDNPELDETVVGLVIWADVDKTNSLTVVLRPQRPKPPGLWRVRWVEIIGPETVDADPGPGIHTTRVVDLGDSIRVTASTGGGHGWFARVGRIRALYCLWWEPVANTMKVGVRTTYFDDHHITVELHATDLALAVVAARVFDADGNLLGMSDAQLLRRPAVTVVPKTKYIIDKSGPKPRRILVHYEQWDYSPASETYTLRADGYADLLVTVAYYHETQGTEEI